MMNIFYITSYDNYVIYMYKTKSEFILNFMNKQRVICKGLFKVISKQKRGKLGIPLTYLLRFCFCHSRGEIHIYIYSII